MLFRSQMSLNKLGQVWRKPIALPFHRSPHAGSSLWFVLSDTPSRKLKDSQAYFLALPKPVWSDDDIRVAAKVVRNPSSPIWKTWTKDPTKFAIIRAIVSCGARPDTRNFDWDMVWALTRKQVCFLHSYSLKVEEVHY